jgi:hypothetical protein
MAQRLQDTDAYILKQFHDKVKHLVAMTPTKAVQAEMAELGLPYLRKLQANGHDMATIASLMRATLGVQKPASAKL